MPSCVPRGDPSVLVLLFRFQLWLVLVFLSTHELSYSTGTSATLERQDVDVRAALLDFHSKYYSANIMALTILTKYIPSHGCVVAAVDMLVVVRRGRVVQMIIP